MHQSGDCADTTIHSNGVLGKLGSLVSSVADSPVAVEEALRLRYKIFQTEMQLGHAGPQSVDRDAWDEICDHLLIHEIGKDDPGERKLVATARLLRAQTARRHGLQLYSQAEFDVEALMARHRGRQFLEIGRTCVAPQWRSRRCVELLWHSIWAYALEHRIDVLVGCASFSGTDVEKLSDPLSYLYHNHPPEEEWQIEPAGESVSMNLKEPNAIDQKAVFRKLPPLIKGYLRLGAVTSNRAVIDGDFGTVDVFIVLPVRKLNPRHVAYYGKNAERHAVSLGGQI